MTLFSDMDFRKSMNKDLIIHPFNEKSLTPIGYDFTIGEFVYSLEQGLIHPKLDKKKKLKFYEIPPKSTTQILTKESLWVSHKIGGIFNSKVSLVSMGFSHISTTLDPGWFGPLLITIRNNLDIPLMLYENDTFVTLLLFYVKSPTKSKHNKPAYRSDILLKQLKNQEKAYINKIESILGNKEIAITEFRKKVELANQGIKDKIISSVKNRTRKEILNGISQFLIFSCIVSLLGLQLYWNFIKQFFGGIDYDSTIFVFQFGSVLTLAVILFKIKKY